MSESILNALIHLFAIVANVNHEGVTAKGRKIVEAYLLRYLSSEFINEYLRLFDNYHEFYQKELDSEDIKDLKDSASIISFQISNVCNQIKKGLLRYERVIVFLQLLEFVYEDHVVTEHEFEFIKTVAKSFSLSENEFNNFRSFIFEGDPKKLEHDNVLVIDNEVKEWSDNLAWIMKKKANNKNLLSIFSGKIYMVKLLYFIYNQYNLLYTGTLEN